jgi:hypothetical protein
MCSNPTAADGTSCSDGNACTTADTCNAGTCTGGAPPNCDDQNPCTVDSCDVATGCVNAPGNPGAVCRGAASACDSAEVCTGTSAACPAPADTSAPVLGAGADQTVVGDCTTTSVTYAKPVVANSGANQCDAGLLPSCTPVAANSYGDHIVTCTAVDASGNVSNSVSFHVTVLQPLALKVQPPLYGDSTAASPNGSVDNVVKDGSTVPVKILVYACGVDVTQTASLTLRLGVQSKQNASDPGTNVVPTFNGAGDAGGVMIWDGTQYHYNLNTKGYAVTSTNASFYQLNVTASYSSNPTVVVGSDAIMVDTK